MNNCDVRCPQAKLGMAGRMVDELMVKRTAFRDSTLIVESAVANWDAEDYMPNYYCNSFRRGED